MAFSHATQIARINCDCVINCLLKRRFKQNYATVNKKNMFLLKHFPKKEFVLMLFILFVTE